MRRRPSLPEIRECAERYHGIPRGGSFEWCGDYHDRSPINVRCRRQIVVLARELTLFGYKEIAAHFSPHGHSSFVEMAHRGRRLVRSDPAFAAEVGAIRGMIERRVEDGRKGAP